MPRTSQLTFCACPDVHCSAAHACSCSCFWKHVRNAGTVIVCSTSASMSSGVVQTCDRLSAGSFRHGRKSMYDDERPKKKCRCGILHAPDGVTAAVVMMSASCCESDSVSRYLEFGGLIPSNESPGCSKDAWCVAEIDQVGLGSSRHLVLRTYYDCLPGVVDFLVPNILIHTCV